MIDLGEAPGALLGTGSIVAFVAFCGVEQWMRDDIISVFPSLCKSPFKIKIDKSWKRLSIRDHQVMLGYFIRQNIFFPVCFFSLFLCAV